MTNKKIQNVELSELQKEQRLGEPVADLKYDLVRGVKVQLRAMLGNAELTVGELFDMREKSILKLDTAVNQPIELILDGNVVARGSLVVVDDNFGIQISEVLK